MQPAVEAALEQPAQPDAPEPAQLETEAEPAQLETEAEPAQLETPTEQAGGACDRYVKDLEHPGENTFDHVLQEINKPAPPQLVQGVLERLKAIRRRYYSDGEKTLQSCIHNLSAVGGPPLLHVLTAAYVVNGGVLLKHTQGHEEAVTDLLVDKQLEAPPETSTVASGRRVLERVSELTDASDRRELEHVSELTDASDKRELERASELTDVPSTSIIVRRERTRSISVEDDESECTRSTDNNLKRTKSTEDTLERTKSIEDNLKRTKSTEDRFEEMKAETRKCEDAAKELEDFLHTLEIEEGI